ncbi:MAG: Ig-like domain-containing protein [Bacteroidales bacterium OttesenSCG-928-I14]|jgi:hypothetical protein|nr:Ig-like domain-containing protein [Bacteroidales bacterium OttesenSCG-928-I14]
MESGPSGGMIDTEPPKFIRSIPPPNTTHFNKKQITLFFDKYIFLKNSLNDIVVSPHQKIDPTIKAIGSKIIIELKDTLIRDMTYTFNFNNCIVDCNEENVLENFNFVFSTGDIVDSLIILGRVLNVETLKPVANAIVGISSDLSDMDFRKIDFLRVSRTNDNGYFQIKNLPPGIYRLFAIKDCVYKNFKFRLQNADFAFGNTLVVPSRYTNVNIDTTVVNGTEIINDNHSITNIIFFRKK